ncbi:hypothetical protein ACFX1X_039446 [Malus domestica]
MSTNEYYRMFTDLSRYDPEVAANPEFYEILLRIEASENLPSERYVVDLLEALGSRGREILVVQVDLVLPYAACVIIGILGSVGEASMVVLLVDRWVIGLPNALRISRDPNNLLSYHLYRPSKLQDIVVILRLDEEMSTTIRATPLPTPQDSSSTLRILSIRVGILSIRKDLCLISNIQSEDLSGIKGDSPSRERLLLVVDDLRGSRVSRGRDVVFMPTQVAVDDSRTRHVSITCHCKMPRIIQI